MPEDSKLKERLVAGFEREGRRRRFDPQAKDELVQACLRPGVSVARIALEHGLNANLLRKWITKYEQQHQLGDVALMRWPASRARYPYPHRPPRVHGWLPNCPTALSCGWSVPVMMRRW
jgi:transposase-like protein